MKKKIYYSVYRETEFDGNIEVCTGSKTAYVYELINNIPTTILSLDLINSDNTEDKILEGLNKDIYSNVELILL